MPARDIKESVLGAIRESWQAHKERLNDPGFRMRYDNLALRILEHVVPGPCSFIFPGMKMRLNQEAQE